MAELSKSQTETPASAERAPRGTTAGCRPPGRDRPCGRSSAGHPRARTPRRPRPRAPGPRPAPPSSPQGPAGPYRSAPRPAAAVAPALPSSESGPGPVAFRPRGPRPAGALPPPAAICSERPLLPPPSRYNWGDMCVCVERLSKKMQFLSSPLLFRLVSHRARAR